VVLGNTNVLFRPYLDHCANEDQYMVRNSGRGAVARPIFIAPADKLASKKLFLCNPPIWPPTIAIFDIRLVQDDAPMRPRAHQTCYRIVLLLIGAVGRIG
jgi:hypothetical protein